MGQDEEVEEQEEGCDQGFLALMPPKARPHLSREAENLAADFGFPKSWLLQGSAEESVSQVLGSAPHCSRSKASERRLWGVGG